MVFAAPLSFLLALELLFDDRQRGAEVPQEEDHEGEPAHEDLGARRGRSARDELGVEHQVPCCCVYFQSTFFLLETSL